MTTFTLDPANPPKMSQQEKDRLDQLSDAEVLAAALSDPDCPPSTPEQLSETRRVVNVRALRTRLHLSQREFAERFQLPIDTVRDWEQHRSQPDRAARVLLKVIDREPEAVERALSEN